MDPQSCSEQKKISLHDYGEFATVYRGTGTVAIVDGAGEKTHSCTFETGQMTDGGIVLLCHDLPEGLSLFFRFGMLAKKFEGLTDNGYRIRSDQPKKSLLQLGFLSKPENLLYDRNLAFKLTELVVGNIDENYHEIHFGICNLQFDDDVEKGDQIDHIIIPIRKEETIELCFKKLNDYDKKIRQILIIGTIDVTCECILKLSNPEELNTIISLMDDICVLLSIKKGTKITWIYYDIKDRQGKTIFRKHASRVTKVYQPLDILYFKKPHSFETKKFLEDSYHPYMKYRDVFKLNHGVVDAYLDAKAESDYFETRAGKVALAIEFLKNEYLESKGENSEYICDRQIFGNFVFQISAAIANTLKSQGMADQNKIQTISDKRRIEGLNRRSFGSILRQFIKEFEVSISPDELSLFIHCRDSLVHRGNFYCKTYRPEERQVCEPLPSILYEYFFMINILDRIFLKILGFDDNMIKIDWRNPSGEIKEWLS